MAVFRSIESQQIIKNFIRSFSSSNVTYFGFDDKRLQIDKKPNEEEVTNNPESKSWLRRLLPIRSIDPGKESHSKLLAEKEMVYELQFHKVKPDCMFDYLTEYERYVAFTKEKATGAELVGSWTVEIGDQDEAIHLWKFPGGYAALNNATEIYRTDPELVAFRLNRNKMLRSRKNQILLGFSFWGEPKQRPAEKSIYELRSYILKPGTMIEWGSSWARGIRARQESHEAVGGFFTHIGDLNAIHHLWAYDNLQERKRVREVAWRKPGWDDCVAYTVPLIRHMKSKILIATPFSNLK